MSPAPARAASRSGTWGRTRLSRNATIPTGAAYRNTDCSTSAYAFTTGAITSLGWLCRSAGVVTVAGSRPACAYAAGRTSSSLPA